MSQAPSLVVFTDLDGTLLNHHDYQWREAEPAVERLRRLGAPLILNSSKTRSEMESLRRELGNSHPFVTENGSAVYTPKGYFTDTPPDAEILEVELLGPPRDEILRVLHAFRRRHGYRFRGFADFSLRELQDVTGLSRDAARKASDRAGTEPLLWLDKRHPPSILARELESHGWRLVSGGRFLHAMGAVDKGEATRLLLSRYSASRYVRHGDLKSMALGDSDNDRGMLEAVDFPIVIPKADGSPWAPGPFPELVHAPMPGSAGWNNAVEARLDLLFSSDPSPA